MFGIDPASIIKGLAEGVVGPLAGMFNKKQDVDLEKFKVDGVVDEKLVAAYVSELQARKDILALTLNTKGGRFMQYIFEVPLGVWWTCIIGYCILHPYFPEIKPVLALPDPLNTWAGWIMAFLFVVSKIDDWRRKT